MLMQVKNGFSITRNQLKWIAAITMVLDHMGVELFPQFIILRAMRKHLMQKFFIIRRL
ncbi:MAG: hypothetical protein PHC41_12835 [Lachnospiraceae bacterium]|nr:hypothetical protein [Lachnospiraceae bacterium]MDD3617092.1 hypothetical protein [Lachnospiraceae bacterium]